MPFNIPGQSSGSNEPFLGRIEYDTRVGFWKIAHRVQREDGSHGDQKTDPFPSSIGIHLLMDFGSIQAGYINFGSKPPVFLLVPYGRPYPQQPEVMRQDDADGKARKAFQPGFRIKVTNPKLFRSSEPYHFAHNSTTVMTAMGGDGGLLDLVMAAPEWLAGQIPVVSIRTNVAVSFGQSKYFAPVFVIGGWRPRSEELFGPRTVEPGVQAQAPATPAYRPPPPSNGTGAAHRISQARTPAPRTEDDWGMPPPTAPGWGSANGPHWEALPKDGDLDDQIPF